MTITLKFDDLKEHPEIVEQLQIAMQGAAAGPEFLRALIAEPDFRRLFKEAITPEQIWLSYAQVQDFLDLPRTTFFEWKKRHEGTLVISTGVGEREPRIKLASILAVMEGKAIRSTQPALPNLPPEPPKLIARTPRGGRLPAVPLRDVALAPRP